MMSARLHAPGQIQVRDEPTPVPAAGEALVRVRAVGVCGSDLQWFAKGRIGDAQLREALVLGHEGAGELANGERVALDPTIPCGRCEWCLKGHPNLCPDVQFAGHGSRDGFLREWITWPRNCLYPLPDTVGAEEGALLEPLGVALHAVDLAKLRTGMTVGVFGCGPIGLLIVQLARLSGVSRIIATDLKQHRHDAARSFGASHSFRAEAGAELPDVLSVTGGRGADVSFEVAGEQSAVDTAIEATCPGGKVILVGIPADDRTAFSASAARRKGLTIKLVRRMKHTYPRAIDLAAAGRIDLRSLVTHRFPLAQTAEAFAIAQRREGLKVIIEL
jgi:L-iditol 2-dehydrogenase